MPLPERRGLHAGGRELTAAPVVVVEPEIVLERVRPHDVVLAVGEAQHDTAGGVFPSGDRLELQRHVDIGIRARRRDDHIEFVPRCSLDEHLLAARRAGHLFHRPLAVHRRPAFDPFRLEVELVSGHVVWHFELLHGVRRAKSRPPRARHEGSHRGFEHRSAREIHRCVLRQRACLQSSFSETVFHSVPLISVTSATGWPSFRLGMTLTAR